MVVYQDKFLESEDFVYASGFDRNGYCPTHNGKYQQPITGVVAKDVQNNRTKRIFSDDVSMRAVANTDPHLVQFYQRDTGGQMWDVSAPINVKGKHWGAFRVGVSVDELERRKAQLLWTLTGLFTAFGLACVGTIYFMVRRAMVPLSALSDLADQISTGEGLENQIKPPSQDEVGKMAKSLDRLRASLKAAMARLGE